MAEQPTAGETSSALATGLALLARIEQSLTRLEHSVEQIHVDIATLKAPPTSLPPQAEVQAGVPQGVAVPADHAHAGVVPAGMPDVAAAPHVAPPVEVAVPPLVQAVPMAQASIPVAVAVPGISITPEQAAVLARQMEAAERLRRRFSGDAPETPVVGSVAPSPVASEAVAVAYAGQETAGQQPGQVHGSPLAAAKAERAQAGPVLSANSTEIIVAAIRQKQAQQEAETESLHGELEHNLPPRPNALEHQPESLQARVEHEAERVSVHTKQGPDLVERLTQLCARLGLSSLLTAKNLWGLAGILLVLASVVFAIRHVALVYDFPPESRLAGAALLGLGMLSLGWFKRHVQRELTLILQGGGVAVLYLTVVAGVRLYPVIPHLLAFAMLVAIVVFSTVLAVLQNALILAHIAYFAGFAAPVLVSTGQGNHVHLFSYFALLNGGLVLVSRFRAWRSLYITGAVLTTAIGVAWGQLAYQPEYFASVQCFIWLFFCIFTYFALSSNQPIQFSWKHKASLFIDVPLTFGVPLVTLFLQLFLMAERPLLLALTALCMGAFYVGLALFVRRQRGLHAAAAIGQEGETRWQGSTLELQLYLVFGMIFANLTLPLLFSQAASIALWQNSLLACIWTVEGAFVMWLGRKHVVPLFTGVGLAGVALGVWYGALSLLGRSVSLLPTVMISSHLDAFAAPSPWGLLVLHAIVTAGVLGAAYQLFARPITLRWFAAVQHTVLVAVAAVFWCATVYNSSKLIQGDAHMWVWLVLAASGVGALYAAHRLRWVACGGIAMVFPLFLIPYGFDVLHVAAMYGQGEPLVWRTPTELFALAASTLALAAAQAVWGGAEADFQKGQNVKGSVPTRFFRWGRVLLLLVAGGGVLSFVDSFMSIGSLIILLVLLVVGIIIGMLVFIVCWKNNWAGKAGVWQMGLMAALFPLFATFAVGTLAGMLGAPGVWQRVPLFAVPLVIFLVAQRFTRLQHYMPALRRIVLQSAFVLLHLWFVADLFTFGDPAPLPFIPLLNPLELMLLGTLLFDYILVRRVQHDAEWSSVVAPMRAYFGRSWLRNASVPQVFAALLFLFANLAVVRACAHLLPMPFTLGVALASPVCQLLFVIVWVLAGGVTMFWALRQAHRGLWIGGGCLVIVAVAKLVLWDMAKADSLWRIAAFFLAGSVFLLIGWFMPKPPQQSVAPADSEPEKAGHEADGPEEAGTAQGHGAGGLFPHEREQ